MELKTTEIGREIELTYKYNKDNWGLTANKQSKRVDRKLLRATWLV